MDEKQAQFERILEVQESLSRLRWEYWREHVVFSWPWWLLIVSTTVAVFWLFQSYNRGMKLQVAAYGFLTLVLATMADTLGAELQLWDYPAMMLPWGSRLFCVDLMISIVFALIYQLFRSWPTFLLAHAAVSAVFSFAFEPFAVWAGAYLPIHWSPIYSFPIYILMAALIKAIIDGLSAAPSGRRAV